MCHELRVDLIATVVFASTFACHLVARTAPLRAAHVHYKHK